MSALRLARAFTGRDRILKFAGGYHGHADALLAQAGSGLATLGIPSSPGVPDAVVADTLVAEYNDLEAVRRLAEHHGDQLAAIIVEPVAGNMGVVAPRAGVPRGPAHRLQRHRRASHRRRGDHRLPDRLRRRPGAVRRPARPDVPGQDRRRRPAGCGVRRPRRRHGAPGARRATSTRPGRSRGTRSRWPPASPRSGAPARARRLRAARAHGRRPRGGPRRPGHHREPGRGDADGVLTTRARCGATPTPPRPTPPGSRRFHAHMLDRGISWRRRSSRRRCPRSPTPRSSSR